MRKFLVVLLILSVMGGVFAQQNNWGAVTGEASLDTTLDFAHKKIEDATMVGSMAGKFVVQWQKTWDNAALGAWTITLPLQASNNYFGTAYSDDPKMMKDTKANVTYVLKDLTVTLPFWFATTGSLYTAEAKDGLIVNEGSGSGNLGILGLPVMESNLDANANWGSDDRKSENYTNWGFRFGVADLYTSPTVSHAGGYYHFLNGRSQLYVSRDSYSYNNKDSGDYNAYETKWWRASDYVLTPKFTSHDAKGAYFDVKATNGVVGSTLYANLFKHLDYKQYEFHWENINENGIAYRFFLIPDVLNVGLAFVSSGAGFKPNTGTFPDNHSWALGNQWIKSGDNAAPFFPANPSLGAAPAAVNGGKGDVDLINDFLRHPVMGVKYDNDTLGVSAMVGLEPWEEAPGNTDVYIHAGAYFQVFDFLKVNGDISAMFATGENDVAYKDLDPAGVSFGPKDIDPNFNFGVEVHYTGSPVWASLGFKMFDLINKDYATFGTDLMVGFGGAVNDGVYNYKGLGDSNAGPVIALKGHVNGFLPRSDATKLFIPKNTFNIGFDLMAGWKDFVLIAAPSEQKAPALTLSVGADLGVDFWFGDVRDIPNSDPLTKIVENHMRTSFKVYPSVDWQVWNNGKISFGYTLGSSDITRAKDNPSVGNGLTLDTNEFKTTFKWEF